MVARVIMRQSGSAAWSRRFGLFAAQILILAALLHRFELISTPAATTLLAVGIAAALLSLVLACAALVQIWRHAQGGLGRALAGLIVSVLTLALPLWYLPELLLRPPLTDVTTALDAPLRFEAVDAGRPGDANDLGPVDANERELQAKSYPDLLRGMMVEKSPQQAFELVHEAIQRLGWSITALREPTTAGPGRIEAVARTPIMAFRDDVVIRVAATEGEARIDVRSASRYGQHDFGANARRIRQLFEQLEAGLEKGEKMAREIALAKRAQELREAREARLAVERREREAREISERAEMQRLIRERTQLQAREALRSEPSLVQSGAQRGPEPTSRRRQRGWVRDPHKFWQQFGG